MKGYLTIKESALLVKRHERTIRRVIVQKRDIINKEESYKAVKYNKRKYYISTTYLHKRYDIDDTKETTSKTEQEGNSEELRELRETVKMYSIMLEAKDKEVLLQSKQIESLENQNKQLFSTLDQSQKLNALEKQLEILKIEK